MPKKGMQFFTPLILTGSDRCAAAAAAPPPQSAGRRPPKQSRKHCLGLRDGQRVRQQRRGGWVDDTRVYGAEGGLTCHMSEGEREREREREIVHQQEPIDCVPTKAPSFPNSGSRKKLANYVRRRQQRAERCQVGARLVGCPTWLLSSTGLRPGQ